MAISDKPSSTDRGASRPSSRGPQNSETRESRPAGRSEDASPASPAGSGPSLAPEPEDGVEISGEAREVAEPGTADVGTMLDGLASWAGDQTEPAQSTQTSPEMMAPYDDVGSHQTSDLSVAQGLHGAADFFGEATRHIGDFLGGGISELTDRYGDFREAATVVSGGVAADLVERFGAEGAADFIRERSATLGAQRNQTIDLIGDFTGDVTRGAADTLGGTFGAVGDLALDPIGGALAIGGAAVDAVRDPIGTGAELVEGFLETAETEGAGFAIGQVGADLFLGRGAGRAVNAAGDAARVSRALPGDGLRDSARLSGEFLENFPEAAAARAGTQGLFEDLGQHFDANRNSPDFDTELASEQFLIENADQLRETARLLDEALEGGSPFLEGRGVTGELLQQGRGDILEGLLDGQLRGPNGEIIELSANDARRLTRGLLADSDPGAPASVVNLPEGTELFQATRSLEASGNYFSPLGTAVLGPRLQQASAALPVNNPALGGRIVAAQPGGVLALQTRVGPQLNNERFVSDAFGGGQQFQVISGQFTDSAPRFTPGSLEAAWRSSDVLGRTGLGLQHGGSIAAGLTVPFLEEILAQEQQQ